MRNAPGLLPRFAIAPPVGEPMFKPLLIAALVLCASPLLADDTVKPKKDDPKDEKSKQWDDICKEVDKNGDGKISKEEMGDRDEAHKALDKNGDGEVTKDEVIERKRTVEEREKLRKEWAERAKFRRHMEEKRKHEDGDHRRLEKKEAERRKENREENAKREDEIRKEQIRKEKEEKDRKKD